LHTHHSAQEADPSASNNCETEGIAGSRERRLFGGRFLVCVSPDKQKTIHGKHTVHLRYSCWFLPQNSKKMILMRTLPHKQEKKEITGWERSEVYALQKQQGRKQN
jgi:putative hemolysin